jgi:hypothetical protein
MGCASCTINGESYPRGYVESAYPETTQNFYSSKQSKVIFVTGSRGPYGCEMLTIAHCVDSRLTDGGKVVSLKRRPRSTAQKHYFSASGTHFC